MTNVYRASVHAMWSIVPIVVYVLVIGLWTASAAAADRSDFPPDGLRLLVLDMEVVGDLSGTSAQDYESRSRKVSDQLRHELSKLPGYTLVDATPAQSRIDELRSVQYLHKCNGCELDLGAELGATHVLVVWIHRVSQLIASLKFEIRAVPSGEVMRASAFDFRGDNEESWSRAVSYMVRDLSE